MKTQKAQTPLLEQEFKLICDAKNGNVQDFKEPYFKKYFIASLVDSICYRFLNDKWSVDAGTLISKLCDMTDKEIIELQHQVDVFWEITERDYARFGFKSPEYLLKKIYNVPISSN